MKANTENLAGLKVISMDEISFIHSSRFQDEKAAIAAYDAIQQILRDNDSITISAYRLFQNWQEAEPSNKPWFVVV